MEKLHAPMKVLELIHSLNMKNNASVFLMVTVVMTTTTTMIIVTVRTSTMTTKEKSSRSTGTPSTPVLSLDTQKTARSACS